MSDLVKITPQQSEALKVMNYTEQAKALVISNVQQAQHVSNINIALAARIDFVKAIHSELCAPAKLIKETADKYCKPALDDMAEARKIQMAKLAEWDKAERERIAAEKQRQEEEALKIRLEAERKARIEREKAEAAAALQRQRAAEAAERERKALEEGNAAAARKAAAERAKALANETAVLEKSAAKAASLTIEAAAKASAMPQVKQAEKLAGTSFRDNWVARLAPGVDMDEALAMLIFEAANGRPELCAYLTINESAIKQTAKAQKGAMRIPGFVSVNEPIVAGARK
jgi:hypothetical protein